MTNRTCSTPDCDKPKVSRGLCSSHYTRWRATNPDAPRCASSVCDRAAITKGLCEGHYTRSRKGQDIEVPLARRRNAGGGSRRDEHGNRECVECLQWLPEDAFARGGSSDGFAPHCKECRGHYRLQMYGLTREQYQQMVEDQDGKCAICGDPPGVRGLSIDHDHACCPEPAQSCGKCVRGLLCGRCNTAIGLLRESPNIITSALEYIEKPLTRRLAQ